MVREVLSQSAALASFFSALRLQIRECGDGTVVAQHIQLRLSVLPSVFLGAEDFTRFSGNLQDWILVWAAPQGTVDTTPHCWRNTDSSPSHAAASRHTSVIVSLPVVLRIEALDDNAVLSDWDVPLLLRPQGSGRGTPVYTLMARIYWRASHFTTRFRWPGSPYVLSYNDLSNLGTVTHLTGSSLKHLAGKQPNTHSLLFILEGGERTQQHFVAERARALRNLFSVEVGPALSGVDIPISLMRPSYVMARPGSNTRDYTLSSYIQEAARALVEPCSSSPEPTPPKELVRALAPPGVSQAPAVTVEDNPKPKPDTPHLKHMCNLPQLEAEAQQRDTTAPHEPSIQCSRCKCPFRAAHQTPDPPVVSSWLCETCEAVSPPLSMDDAKSTFLRTKAEECFNTALAHPIRKLNPIPSPFTTPDPCHPVTQDICPYCEDPMQLLTPRMRNHLLRTVACYPRRLTPGASGAWMIDLPGFSQLEKMMLEFCQTHRILTDYCGPGFPIDFDSLHGRIIAMEPYLRTVWKQPETYPLFSDVKLAITRGVQSQLVRFASRA